MLRIRFSVWLGAMAHKHRFIVMIVIRVFDSTFHLGEGTGLRVRVRARARVIVRVRVRVRVTVKVRVRVAAVRVGTWVSFYVITIICFRRTVLCLWLGLG